MSTPENLLRAAEGLEERDGILASFVTLVALLVEKGVFTEQEFEEKLEKALLIRKENK